MKKMWTPELVIALVIILFTGAMICFGINGEVKSVFVMASAWTIRAAFKAKTEVK